MNNLELIGIAGAILTLLLLVCFVLTSIEWKPEYKCTEYTNAKELAHIDYDMQDVKLINGNYVICTETTMVMVRYKDVEK